MKYNYLTKSQIDAFIQAALQEDVRDGDHSTLASVPENAQKKAHLLVKDEGIIAGLDLAKYIFDAVAPNLTIDFRIKDGEYVKFGDIAFIVSGNARAILTAERLVLNCMQRMSGIATYTHNVMELLKDTDCKILDTRKTTPNARLIEKWAVKIGGGENHRFGLFDMIMLKDNHCDFAGGIEAAVNATKKYLKETQKDLLIEVETRNLEEVNQALEVGGVHTIMLDNMDIPMMTEAVKIIGDKATTEASGGITLETVRNIALCGVDYISMGALTHSYKSLDMSLKAI